MPKAVRIVEVGPRDGLQNEAEIVSTADKVRFIALLTASGLRDIEVSSFVSPARVPQLADAAEVFALLPENPNVRYSALVPNAKGLQRALNAGVKHIAVFTAASETFTQRNIGRTIAESLAAFRLMMQDAHDAGCHVRAYVSTAFVCPYEGRILPAQVLPVVAELLEMGADEISVGDTIGHAEPDDIALLTESLLPLLPLQKFAYHFHDTKQTALVNVERALQYGISIYDSSAGGLGGCPFALGAEGNLATEALLSLLHSHAIETGVNAEAIATASRFILPKLRPEPR